MKAKSTNGVTQARGKQTLRVAIFLRPELPQIASFYCLRCRLARCNRSPLAFPSVNLLIQTKIADFDKREQKH